MSSHFGKGCCSLRSDAGKNNLSYSSDPVKPFGSGQLMPADRGDRGNELLSQGYLQSLGNLDLIQISVSKFH